MTRIEVTVSSEYGIMFIHDAVGDYVIPINAGKNSVTFTETCVAFSVLSYVDGNAKIVIDHELRNGDGGVVVFEGLIKCNSKSLALTDHMGCQFASVPLESEYGDVKIMMSDQPNPDIVFCLVKNIVTY